MGNESSPIIVDKALRITLWYLNNRVSIRDVSDRFNVANSSVFSSNCSVVHKLCKVMSDNTDAVIYWPVGNPRSEVA